MMLGNTIEVKSNLFVKYILISVFWWEKRWERLNSTYFIFLRKSTLAYIHC